MSRVRAAEWLDRWGLAAIVALGALLRFSTLGVQSFWFDETQTVSLLHLPFASMLSGILGTEITPPFYDIVAWPWVRVFGDTEVGLRSLSALAGTATIPIAYAAARRVVSRDAALVGGLLVAVNPMLVWYSQEARSYAMVVFVTTAALYFFAAGLDSAEHRSGWGVFAGLALVTHYFAVFASGAEAVLLLVLGRARRATLTAITMVAVVGVGVLTTEQLQAARPDAATVVGGLSLATRLEDVAKEFLLGPNGHRTFAHAAAIAAALAGIALVGLILSSGRGGRRGRRGALVMGLTSILTVGGALSFALLGSDYLTARNVIPALVPLLLCLGAAFTAARRRGPVRAALAVYVLMSVVTVAWVALTPRLQREDWRDAARALGPASVDRAVVVKPYALSTVTYYMPALAAHAVGPGQPPASVVEFDVLEVGDVYRRQEAPNPGPGFTFVGRTEGANYSLLRFRAQRPTPFTAANVAGPTSAIFIQPKSP